MQHVLVSGGAIVSGRSFPGAGPDPSVVRSIGAPPIVPSLGGAVGRDAAAPPYVGGGGPHNHAGRAVAGRGAVAPVPVAAVRPGARRDRAPALGPVGAGPTFPSREASPS